MTYGKHRVQTKFLMCTQWCYWYGSCRRHVMYNKELPLGPSPGDEPWATISPEGRILRFDNNLCRNLSLEWDMGSRGQAQCIAKLIVGVLDGAAASVCHIGIAGDVVEKFNVDRKGE